MTAPQQARPLVRPQQQHFCIPASPFAPATSTPAPAHLDDFPPAHTFDLEGLLALQSELMGSLGPPAVHGVGSTNLSRPLPVVTEGIPTCEGMPLPPLAQLHLGLDPPTLPQVREETKGMPLPLLSTLPLDQLLSCQKKHIN